MLKTRQEHLESLRDGRVVYVGDEQITDVTAHPYFKNCAASIANIYDLKRSATVRDKMSFSENGEDFSAYFLRARSADDLRKRRNAHKVIADASYGMFGRSPDHVASFVTGMAMAPEIFGERGPQITAYYDHMRTNDIFTSYAILSPQSTRNPEYSARVPSSPALRVTREDAKGVYVSGMKMLATGAIFANEVWIGNILPLSPDQAAESITCAVPCNAKGLALWSRKPIEATARNEFEAPLSYRFDETDAMLICNEVYVPWERVFVHNDADLARQIYIKTAAHSYGNHQSNVRFLSKLQLLVGLASRITHATGADQVPAVRETLGRLVSLEAMLTGLIDGQIEGAEDYPSDGWKCVNRRSVYAALNWCTESYSEIVDKLRELCGGGVFQMPADISVVRDPALRQVFETYWDTPQLSAVDRMKLFKLAWDLVGSEFAGRHQQYEKFYAGASFVVRNYSFIHAPWSDLHDVVDGLLNSYDVPSEPVAI